MAEGAGLAKELAKRVVRAALSGVLAYITSYTIPMYLLSRAFETLEQYVPVVGLPSPTRLLYYFAFITVFYTVAVEFTRDTVFEHFFSVGRGLTFLFFFIYVSRGGVMSLGVPLSQLGLPGLGVVGITLDVSRVLFVLIGIDLLDIGKSVVNAVDFMSRKAEEELEKELMPIRKPAPALALPGKLGLVLLVILMAIAVLVGVMLLFMLKGGLGFPLPFGP